MDATTETNIPSIADDNSSFYGSSGMKFPNDVSQFTWNDLEHFTRLQVEEVTKTEFSKGECEALIHALFNYEDCTSAVEEEIKLHTSNVVEDLVEHHIESEIEWEKVVAKHLIHHGKDLISELVWEILENRNDYAEILDRTVMKVEVIERLLGIEDEDHD